MKLLMHEVLQKVSNAKTKKEKITLLEKFNTPALRMLFIINFDESVISMLPPGKVPYTPSEAPDGTEALPKTLSEMNKSDSTVGLPLLSIISLDLISKILTTIIINYLFS